MPSGCPKTTVHPPIFKFHCAPPPYTMLRVPRCRKFDFAGPESTIYRAPRMANGCPETLKVSVADAFRVCQPKQ